MIPETGQGDKIKELYREKHTEENLDDRTTQAIQRRAEDEDSIGSKGLEGCRQEGE
jgi:hypothetical protein